MNVFTTDHPLCSDSGPGHESSTLACVLGFALVLFPFVLGLFWFLNATDNRDTTGYPPDPFWDVCQGAVMLSIVAALVIVALWRLFASMCRELWHGAGVK